MEGMIEEGYDEHERSRPKRWSGRLTVRGGNDLKPRLFVLFLFALLIASISVAPCSAVAATTPAPAWSVTTVAEPTIFDPALDQAGPDHEGCEAEWPHHEFFSACNYYTIVVTNVGGAPSSGMVTVTDQLPPGVRAVIGGLSHQVINDEVVYQPGDPAKGTCVGEHVVTCTTEVSVAPYTNLFIGIPVVIEGGTKEVSDSATVEGGGAVSPVISASVNTEISEQTSAPFEITQAFQQAYTQSGLDAQAGDHPAALTTGFFFSNGYQPEAQGRSEPTLALRSSGVVHDEVIDLPAGLVGDPRALPACPLAELRRLSKNVTLCPAGSEVGVIMIRMEGNPGKYNGSLSGGDAERFVSSIYNVVPEAGYPAEFGFEFEGIPVIMHAEVGPPPSYGLRVTVPGQTSAVVINGAIVTFFGDPAEHDDVGSPSTAFLTNPSNCAAGPLNASLAVDTQEHPQPFLAQQMEAFPSLSGCESLSFTPSLSYTPETTERDTPSGYEAVLTVPQAPNVAPYTATPPLRTATVTLPAGIAVSPGGAQGLVACSERGPEGFNDVGGQTAPDGRDLTDPYATELGEGHAGPGGNSSPYDDGLYHTAPGHCPAASTIGTVKIKTPLLEEELEGHVYLAEPKCGAAGLPECTPQAAEEGKIFGIYLEAAGSGVIVKLTGKVSAIASSGQLTAEFAENPQLPFSELHLRFKGGARAPLATPQTCGVYTTTSLLDPWSAPQTPTATSLSSFTTTGCASSMPFAPSFTAGTVRTEGGAFSPFTMSIKRGDGEQDLAGVDITMPPGVAGMISKVPLCSEAQANAGSCPEASRIGTAHVAAGAGSAPLWLEGRVYLTGPYKSDPFGLSIVVPAVAGPFNLGNEVVRAGIAVNPYIGEVSVASERLRLSRDGVPFRLKEINVEVNKPGFMFNPTNCSKLSVTGTVFGDLPDGAAGATVPVSSSFAASGCKNLPFHPSFKAETHAYHSRKKGSFLKVTIAAKEGEANLGKVHVTLPKKLPADLATLKLACGEAQFNANPAGCPKESFVGSVVVHTPVLAKPLTGPAIYVGHGGAKFPDLALLLQGEGVTIIQEGATNIAKGLTSSSFDTIPDLPVSSIEVTLPERSNPALGGPPDNLCYRTVTKRVKRRVRGKAVYRKRRIKKRLALIMPTTVTGQNGAVMQQRTKLTVRGCAKGKQVKAAIRHRDHHGNYKHRGRGRK